jgi:dienelactone hydrolase
VAAASVHAGDAETSSYLQGGWSYAANPGSRVEDGVALTIDARQGDQVTARISYLGVRCALNDALARGGENAGKLVLEIEPQGRCPAATLTLQRSPDGAYGGTMEFATLTPPINVTLRATSPPAAPLARQWSDDTARAWNGAYVFMPQKVFPVRPADVSLTMPMPVILFMHGCSGFNAHDWQLMNWVSAKGYVAVAPDSFKRVSRPFGCNSSSHVYGSKFLKLVSYRIEEVDYALDQLAMLPWVDRRRVFLVGHSEGGNTASRVSASGFRGIVISGDSCGAGILAPAETPVLAIRFDQDPWYVGKQNKCPAAVAARTDAHYVELSGGGHWPFQDPLGLAALDDFLNRNSAKTMLSENVNAN